MIIGQACCCDVPEFARKTAMLTVPFPGLGEFFKDGSFISNRTGWQASKYLTTRVQTVNLTTGAQSSVITRTNRYTGATASFTETDPGFSNTGGFRQPAVLVGPAHWYELFTSPFDSGMRVNHYLEDANDYAGAVAFWRPYFDAVFPTSSMPNPTTVTAYDGSEQTREFDFVTNYNHVIGLTPRAIGYNDGAWDGTFSFDLDFNGGISAFAGYPNGWLGGGPFPKGESGLDGLPVLDNGVWRVSQSAIIFVKSCLQLTQGINCDTDYYPAPVHDGQDFSLQDVVCGVCDIATGIVDRIVLNLRLSPGVFTFYDTIIAHSGSVLSMSVPELEDGQLILFSFRQPGSGVPHIDDPVFNIVPDYCPP